MKDAAMNRELFIEIGTEEIPAGFIPDALSALSSALEREFKNYRIGYAQIRTMGTPRRLVGIVESLSEKQETLVIEKIGPARNLAFDQNGNPTKAAIGFARSQGVEVSQLETVRNDKGEYLCARKKEEGRVTREVLSEFLPGVITSLPFKKSMRWGNSNISFARPIHWITAVYGGKVVPFHLGEIESGTCSYGHRFLSPGSFEVKDSPSYLECTRKAQVIADQEERKKIIRAEVKKAAASVSGVPLEDEELLEEVNNLVEYPVVLAGTFPAEYLKLPHEVLITCMKSHQKYFPVTDIKNNLLPYFIVVTNTLTKDPHVVIKGNERVLVARLADARFFFEEDLKVSLIQRAEKLKGVLFHSRLGTSYEKVERFTTLAARIADLLFPELKRDVERSALLCKTDLVSGMVGEFPELQGVMGREYALRSGEKREVAEAIFEHYLPRFAGDRLPETDTGALVSIADKLDTIAGCFGVGLIPTGAADPYALRRQALGIINIVLDKGYNVSLSALLEMSLSLLTAKLSRKREEVKADVIEFFRARMANQLITQGFSYDVVDAALSRDFDDLFECFKRVKALQKMKGEPYFEPLAITFKRAMNIIKESVETQVNPSLFEGKAEENLLSAYEEVKQKAEALLRQKDYLACFEEMAKLKGPIDAFFDGVMVMVDDERIRKNRLALLSGITNLFGRIADFSKIVTE
jgi:glycyl-tRNA synthetase beta chain